MNLEDVQNHAFNKSIRDTFAEATDISDVRAMEYGDSWDLSQMSEGLLGSTLALPEVVGLRREFIRLVRCAVMVDIKESRRAGPWKDDTYTDYLNYLAAYIQWRAAFMIAALPFADPEKPGAMGFPEEFPSEGFTHGNLRTCGTSCPGCTGCR